MIGGAIHGQVTMDKKTNRASHEEEASNQHSPWFMLWLPLVMQPLSQINPFSPSFFWSWCFITAIESKPEISATFSGDYYNSILLGRQWKEFGTLGGKVIESSELNELFWKFVK